MVSRRAAATLVVLVVFTVGVMASGLSWSARIGLVLLGMLVTALARYAISLRDRYRTLRSSADRQLLYAEGQPAEGTVIDIEHLQEAFRGDPVVRVRMRLAPTDGSAPVEASRELFVSTLIVSWLGEQIAAFYDRDDPDRFILVTEIDADMPPHVRELHERLRAAPPVAGRPLPRLVAAVARLGQLQAELQAGQLSREEHFELSNDLYNQAFP